MLTSGVIGFIGGLISGGTILILREFVSDFFERRRQNRRISYYRGAIYGIYVGMKVKLERVGLKKIELNLLLSMIDSYNRIFPEVLAKGKFTSAMDVAMDTFIFEHRLRKIAVMFEDQDILPYSVVKEEFELLDNALTIRGRLKDT
jgi:hypothetical protein